MEGGNNTARHAAGTSECEVHADASGAEGRGMNASEDFAVFATRSEPTPSAADVVGGGPVGSQGVAQAPMPHTDTTGTSECEAHADACGAEGRGMDAIEGICCLGEDGCFRARCRWHVRR